MYVPLPAAARPPTHRLAHNIADRVSVGVTDRVAEHVAVNVADGFTVRIAVHLADDVAVGKAVNISDGFAHLFALLQSSTAASQLETRRA